MRHSPIAISLTLLAGTPILSATGDPASPLAQDADQQTTPASGPAATPPTASTLPPASASTPGTEPAIAPQSPFEGTADLTREHLLLPAADPELINNSRKLAFNPDLPEHEKLSLIIEITTALQLGSDPQAEDAEGNSAMLYLSTTPNILQALRDTGLLKNLREEQPLPTSTDAFLRLLRTRCLQLQAGLPEASLTYLQHYSLQPAAENARQMIGDILNAPLATGHSPAALADCLSFLRAQDEPSALELISSLPYWEHGEHFLESSPGQLLEVLHELCWPVPSDKLKQAITKLDSMLPTSPEDMIDCNAAHPLALLLDMLVQQEGNAAWDLVSPYLDSSDPEMACAALVLDLHRRGLPGPDAATLRPYLGNLEGNDALQLSELILACQIDQIIEKEQTHLLDTERLERAVTALHKIGAHTHAGIIAKHLAQADKIERATLLRQLCQEYNYLNTESTRLQAARFILAHPHLFRQTTP